MGLLDFLKKKKPLPDKVRKGKKQVKIKKKVEEKKEVKKEVKKKTSETSVLPRRKTKGLASFVLKSPHVTEKATSLIDINQYIFNVFPTSSKGSIKRAVEDVYGVNVLKVRTIKIPGKKRRLGKTIGWKKGYKKAIVTLAKGQKIEIMPK